MKTDSPTRFMCGTHGFRIVEDNDCEECAAVLADAQGFQKPSGEAKPDDQLPVEPSIRVRENGDVAGVASGHPEDSSASPGHRASDGANIIASHLGACEDLGFALEHLRILTGPICEPCWEDEGALTPATENHSGTEYCSDCYSNMAERAHEAMCEDFYGGSGPSEQDRFESRRDSGRRA